MNEKKKKTLEGTVVENGEKEHVARALHLREDGLARTAEVDERADLGGVSLDAGEIVTIHVIRKKNPAPFPGLCNVCRTQNRRFGLVELTVDACARFATLCRKYHIIWIE